MALSVVTFNIGGGEGTRDEKKKMIDKFLSEHLPSFLYFQENPWRRPYIKKHVSVIRENYEAVSHEHFDATVFYRKDVLRDEGSGQLMRIFRDAFSDKDHLDFVTFRERASFSELTEIKTGTTFIAISWHGEYIGLRDPQKKDKFKDLLLVMTQIHSQTHLPVILGGDFNIALDTVSYIIEEQGFEVYDYEPVNRKTVIDFFVVTPNVELSGLSALGDYMYINVSVPQRQQLVDKQLSGFLGSQKRKYVIIGHIEKRKQVFDHDPVKALVTFDFDSTYENVASEKESEDSEEELDDLAHYFRNVLFKEA